MATLFAARRTAYGSKENQEGGWQDRHDRAIRLSSFDHKPFELPLVQMLTGWADYALTYRERFEQPIGEDFVLGVSWREMGLSIRALLNGEAGRLDCGTLDGFILDTLKENGFDTETL